MDKLDERFDLGQISSIHLKVSGTHHNTPNTKQNSLHRPMTTQLTN